MSDRGRQKKAFMSHSSDSISDPELNKTDEVCTPVDLVPRHTSEYSTQAYWDWRYQQYHFKLKTYSLKSL